MMSDAEPSRLMALIPAYNEARHLPQVVCGVLAYLPALIVDDGSTDDTAAAAKAAGAAVVRQIPNQGKGAALRAGFHWAIEQNYDAVLTLDADGQHDPTEIPKFLQTFQEYRPDLIIGSRDFSQMPPVRRWSNTLGGWAFSWAVGRSIRDNQSGYRLLSRRMMAAVLNSHEQGFEFEVEMIVVCLQHNFKLDWVPIRTIYAGQGSHIDPVRHLVNFLRVVWQTRQRLQRAY
jgi:glycosyltransferase involved in cell wall biosynthesis